MGMDEVSANKIMANLLFNTTGAETQLETLAEKAAKSAQTVEEAFSKIKLTVGTGIAGMSDDAVAKTTATQQARAEAILKESSAKQDAIVAESANKQVLAREKADAQIITDAEKASAQRIAIEQKTAAEVALTNAKTGLVNTKAGAVENTVAAQMAVQKAKEQTILEESEAKKATLTATGEAKISAIQAEEALTRQATLQKEAQTEQATIEAQLAKEKLAYTQARETAFANAGSMSDLLTRHLSWLVSGGLVVGTLSLLKDGLISVENGMKNLATVLPSLETNQQAYNQAEQEAIGIMQKYGASLDDTMTAARSFGRMYKDTNTVMALVNDSVLMNVIDQVKLDDAVKGNEATLAVYGKGLKSFNDIMALSNHTMDSWTNLSHNSLASATDLIEITQRAAGAANVAKTSFDQLMGVGAAMVRATGLPGANVGNTIKSLMATFSAPSKQAEKAIDNVGVSMRKTNGELKSGYDIILDLALATDGAKASAEDLATAEEKAAGGRFQYSKTAALLGSFDQIVKDTALSINSQGVTAEKAATQLDTVQRKAQELHATLIKMFSDVGDNGLRDTIKGLLSIVDQFMMGLEGINPGVINFGVKMLAAVAGLKVASTAIKTLTNAVVALGLRFTGLTAAQARQAVATNGATTALTMNKAQLLASIGVTEEETVATAGLTAAEEGATVATGGLKGALAALNLAWKSNPIGLVITGLMQLASIALPIFITNMGAAKEKQLELNDAMKDSNTTALQMNNQRNSEISFLESMKTKEDELNQKINSGKLGSKDLSAAKKDLKAVEVAVGDAIDDTTKKRMSSLGISDKEIDKIVSLLKTENEETIQHTKDEKQRTSDTLSGVEARIQAYNAELKTIRSALNDQKEQMENDSPLGKIKDFLNNYLDPFEQNGTLNLENKYKKLSKEEKNLAQQKKDLTAQIKKNDAAIQELTQANASLSDSDDNVAGSEENEADTIKAADDALKDYIDSVKQAVDETKQLLQATQDLININSAQYDYYSASNTVEDQLKAAQLQIEKIGLFKDELQGIHETANADRSAASDLATGIGSISTAATSAAGSVSTLSGNLATYFENASNATGVSTSLLEAVAKQESGFNQGARSGAGAIGIMQLMPGTAKGVGVNAYDEAQNILGGAKVLASAIQTYGNNLELVLASYNAGSGAVAKAVKKAGSTSWSAVSKYLPSETRSYVPAVLANLGGASATTSSSSSDSDDAASARKSLLQTLQDEANQSADYESQARQNQVDWWKTNSEIANMELGGEKNQDYVRALRAQDIEDTKNQIDYLKDNASSLSDYNTELQLTSKLTGLYNDKISEMNHKIADQEDYINKLKTAQAKYDPNSDEYKTYSKLISDGTTTLTGYKKELYDTKQAQDELNDSTPENTIAFIGKLKDAGVDTNEMMLDYLSTLKLSNYTWEEQVNIIKDVEDAITALVQTEVDKRTAAINKEKDAYDAASDARTTALQNELDLLNTEDEEAETQKEIASAESSLADAQETLTKAQTKLSNVKAEKNTRVFENGVWSYIANPSDVKEAQEAVTEAENSFNDAQESYWETMDSVEEAAYKKSLQTQIDAEKDVKDEKDKYYEQEITDLDTQKDKVVQSILTGGTKFKDAIKQIFGNDITPEIEKQLEALDEKVMASVNALTAAMESVGGGSISTIGSTSGSSSTASPTYTGTVSALQSSDWTKVTSYDTGGEVPEDQFALVHKGEWVLNKNDVSDLGGLAGVRSMVSALKGTSSQSITNSSISNDNSHTTVDKGITIENFNAPHIYDVSGLMRNLENLARR